MTAGSTATGAADGPLGGLRVAEATDADVEGLVELWEACGLTRPWNDPRRDIADARASVDAAVLVGRLGADEPGASELVASALVGFDGHRGWLYYVAVDPAARRAGVGRHLVVAGEAWLAARGARKTELMVRHGNDGAQGFWAALGYTDQSVTVLGRWLAGT